MTIQSAIVTWHGGMVKAIEGIVLHRTRLPGNAGGAERLVTAKRLEFYKASILMKHPSLLRVV